MNEVSVIPRSAVPHALGPSDCALVHYTACSLLTRSVTRIHRRTRQTHRFEQKEDVKSLEVH